MKIFSLLLQQVKVFLQSWYGIIVEKKFEGSCLKQEDKAAFTPKNVIIFFILHELDSWPRDLNTGFTFGGCLFESVKLTKISDLDKYSCRGYGIVFVT